MCAAHSLTSRPHGRGHRVSGAMLPRFGASCTPPSCTLRLAAPVCAVAALLPPSRTGHDHFPTVPLSREIFTRARCLLCCVLGQARRCGSRRLCADAAAAVPSSSRVHARTLTAAASLLLLAAHRAALSIVACVVPVLLAAKAEPSCPSTPFKALHTKPR
jgi:hypothetical protein